MTPAILSEACSTHPWTAPADPEVFSELSLRGAAGNCLSLLAPILRELSEQQDARWLTLIAPPCQPDPRLGCATPGLNRERILLLQPTRRPERPATDLRGIAPGA
jgi:cell division inhibitor SulA